MPAERINMRKIREVLRLKNELGLSRRQIATSCNIGKTSVKRYLERANKAKLSWPLPANLADAALELLLYPSEARFRHEMPDLERIHQELKRKGVTLYLLWEEYKERVPNGISYSRICQIYRDFKGQLHPSMRQNHKAGEKLFVDYSGLTVPYVNRDTGEVYQAQVFVGVLGASNYTYAEATKSQSLPDWIGSHIRMFKFFGGVPEVLVPDNLKSGVTKAHYYDPAINPTYQDLANHYRVAIVPARVRKPKDKAKVEVGVQGIERRILAKLRNQTFFNVVEINAAIKPLLAEYNTSNFQKLPGSRLTEFVEVDKPALKPLPQHGYSYAEWKKVRAGIDYHISFERHYYSVPHKYNKQQLDLRITSTMLECFYQNKSVVVHRRSYKKGYTTIKEHMPKRHQEHAEWTPERLMNWAKKTGGQTAALIRAIIDSKPMPQQAFRACIGVMRLGNNYGQDRLEMASTRALALGAISYLSVESILKKGLEKLPLPTVEDSTSIPPHDNVRGSDYYC
ncbi:MAG: IS21 family transposase [Gammaproteobacteria bacterium]|nr:IS21 family transposase [Gammaproteobacteria bacterium]